MTEWNIILKDHFDDKKVVVSSLGIVQRPKAIVMDGSDTVEQEV